MATENTLNGKLGIGRRAFLERAAWAVTVASQGGKRREEPDPVPPNNA